MATLQTDPERFGCIEGQGDYSGPDGHTAINTMGEMEPGSLEAPPTPQRGTGRKRGRPKKQRIEESPVDTSRGQSVEDEVTRSD